MPNTNLKEMIEKIGVQNIIIGVLSVVLLYVLFRSFSFSTTENVDKKAKDNMNAMSNLDQKVMDMSRQLDAKLSSLSSSFSQLANSREMAISRSLYRAPYINVVNRRPITLTNTTITAMTEANRQSLTNVIYGPFRFYASPAVAPGAKRKWRLYAVYNDNLAPKVDGVYTHGFFLRIDVEKEWNNRETFPLKFKLGGTWSGISPNGVPNYSRDGYSDMIQIPSEYPESVHAPGGFLGYIDNVNSIYALDATKPENCLVKLFYLELQALDVYE